MKSIEKSITFCSESVDDFGTKLDSAINKISETEKKMQVYKLQCNTTINNTEQLTLANNIEIILGSDLNSLDCIVLTEAWLSRNNLNYKIKNFYAIKINDNLFN